MNKSIINFIFLGLLAGSSACTSEFEDFNTNPYAADHEQMEYDGFAPRAALISMEGYVIPLDVNLFQFTDCLLGGSYGGYISDSNNGFNAGKFSTYNPQEHWLRAPFNDVIPRIFINLKDVRESTKDPVLLAVADVVKVAAISRITDIYGPIPYSKLGVDGKLAAPYDSQKEVYMKMFEELDNAISTLTKHSTEDFNSNADRVFGGKVIKWVKFANSLKLRMAMRIVYADANIAQKKAEEAVNHEIGVMSSNNDNAFIPVNSKNPFRVIMYEYNGGDSRISSDITSYMNGYKDPRRSKYFTVSTFEGADKNGFIGLRNGIQIPSGGIAHSYSNMVVSEDSKLMWMNAAETAFLKAEGAIRGWNMGPVEGGVTDAAEGFYNKGIALSFDQWGVAAEAQAYMNNALNVPEVYKDPMGTFSYNGTTSNVTIKWSATEGFERKLERIITQKWIANFPLGLEAWAEYRRTGYPKLMEVVDNKSGGIVNSSQMARRLPFPTDEYNLNGANMPGALKVLNGTDNMATHVWWDCKK